jgi:UDP-N-acetylmuramyl tripeptide synthase
MRKIVAILITKLLHFGLGLIGKGSAKPGEIGLKIYRDVLGEIKLPKKIIAVTGTTGKTSTTMMLNTIFSEAGVSIAHNLKGSNLLEGITTTILCNSTLTGKFKKDVLLLEVDERYAKLVFKYFKPTDLLVTNLSRDQLIRNTHQEFVFEDVKKILDPSTTLYLNVDDPLTNKFSLFHKGKIVNLGVNVDALKSKKTNEVLDMNYCPKCGSKIDFDSFNYSNLGNYACSKCDFMRYKPDYEVTEIKEDHLLLNGLALPFINKAFYNIYNILFAYTLASTTGVKDEIIAKALKSKGVQSRRLDTFKFNHRDGLLLLSKNETPISYNQSIRSVNDITGEKTVLLGFNNVSGRYNEKDLSWMYDINFEGLNDDSITSIICIGRFASNIALRLKYAGIDQSKIAVQPEMSKIKESLTVTNGFICAVLYFDTYQEFKKIIGGEM